MRKQNRCPMPGPGVPALMIKTMFLFFALFFLTGTAMAQEAEDEQPQLVQVVQSSKSFSETLTAFREEAGKAGWSILNENNMAGVLSERGFTLDPVVILDVCSGQYSARILGKDDYRPISAFMPCRVSIYKTSDGKVFVARMNTTAFVDMMPPEVAQVMSSSDQEVDEIITRAAR